MLLRDRCCSLYSFSRWRLSTGILLSPVERIFINLQEILETSIRKQLSRIRVNLFFLWACGISIYLYDIGQRNNGVSERVVFRTAF